MNSLKQIHTIGVASCLGGSETTCYTAPAVIKYSKHSSILNANDLQLYWQDILSQNFLAPNRLNELININHRIASYTAQTVINQKQFLVISGDHSSAMGTWAGAQNGLKQRQTNASFGLIWLDAHLDAHTLHSSPSGNFHGMPVSAILGLAEPALLSAYPSSHYFSSQDILIYGVRSFESSEQELLQEQNVSFYPFEISSRMNKEKNDFLLKCYQLIERCDGIGISLDLDILDPFEAPAVETAVANGLKKSYLIDILKSLREHAKNKFVGLEISEFNPINDKAGKTEKAIFEIIVQLFA